MRSDVYLDVTVAEQSPGKQLAGFDSHWCELQHASVGRRLVDHITDGVNILNVRLLESSQYLLIPWLIQASI